jgi:hypothetical protein
MSPKQADERADKKATEQLEHLSSALVEGA